jgi:hypothetical protein
MQIQKEENDNLVELSEEANIKSLLNMVKNLEDNAYELFLKYKQNNENYIFVLWCGNNSITPNRLKSLKQLMEKSECHLIYVTANNISNFILNEHPFHEAYKYLSVTHQSDYVRGYLMHFYGGGYSDIKKTTGSWKKSFEELMNSDKWMIGYKWEDKEYYNWIGNGAYIVKPNTQLTNEWYFEFSNFLDNNLDILKIYPAQHFRDCYETSNNKYPIRWAGFNIILNKITDKYKEKLLNTLPICVCKDYL